MASGLTDVDYPRALLVALGLTIGLALVVAASTSAVAFGAYNAAWDGATDLRTEAAAAGARSEVVLNTSRYGQVRPNETVAVVLSPDERYRRTESTRLRRFVQGGGTLVVAEDFGPHSNPLLAAVGVDARFAGPLLRDERYNYRTPAMPVARNVSNHSLATGVDALTLNHGTVIEPPDGALGGPTDGTADGPNDGAVIVLSSEFGYLDVNRNGELDENESLGGYPVVTVERVGAGRVVAVSDPSLFINAMLERSGNRRFVRNLFAGNELAVLDYSHVSALPPLAVAVLIVRSTPLLQSLLGLVGVIAVVAWGRGSIDRVAGRVGALIGRGTDRGVGVDLDEMTAYLRRHHPDWDEERVRRVTQGVLPRRAESGDDE